MHQGIAQSDLEDRPMPGSITSIGQEAKQRQGGD